MLDGARCVSTSSNGHGPPGPTTHGNVLRTAFRVSPTEEILEFGTFVTNRSARVSNTFEGWYQVPLFVFNSQLVRKLRGKDGTTGRTHRISFRLGDSDRVFEIDISPAQILSPDGSEQQAHYPGPSEERVLEALFHLAAQPGCGASALGFAAVRFTYAALGDELTRHGHKMSHRQISLSLQILNQTRMIIRDPKVKEPIYSGSPLPQIVRDTPSPDRRKIVLIAEFSAPVAALIGRGSYRQIDYERLMQIRHPVARFLYKRLVHKYTYADMMNSYNFSFSSVRSAGLLDSYNARVDRQRPVVKDALDELVERQVIRPSYDVAVRHAPTGRRVVEDVVYTVAATKQFVMEQKAAGKRSKELTVRRRAVSDTSNVVALDRQ